MAPAADRQHHHHRRVSACSFRARVIKDIYRANTRPVPGFPQENVGTVDDFLYSGIVTVTLTY